MATDIKISDEELAAEIERALQETTAAEEVLSGLYDIISNIDQNSIQGAVKTNFNTFVFLVGDMKGQLEALIQEEQQLITRFIADIDEADLTLYQGV